MAAGDALRDGSLWHRRCADEFAALETSAALGAWTTWSPTYGAGGAMTYTTVTSNYAKYRQQGKTVHFAIYATGTTGGVAAPNISFTLPVAAASVYGITFGALVSDGGNPLPGTARGLDVNTLYVAKFDYSNFGLGASRVFAVSGCYEAA